MRFTYRAAIGAALAVLVAGLMLSSRVVAQQPKEAAAQRGSAATALTPWGDPDLTGIWMSFTKTPFQRRRAGDPPPIDDEAGPELGAEGNTPALKDPLGNPLIDKATGNGPEHWYEFNLARPTGQPSLVIDPPDGRIPALTPDAQKRRLAYLATMTGVPRDMPPPGGWIETFADPWLRCITRGVPGMWSPNAYNMNFLINQSPGYVTILTEMVHETRVIPLNARAPLPSNVPQWLGDSRGHWEGKTLVVESTNFHPDLDVDRYIKEWYGTPKMHIVERFTRVDANTIDFRYTIDDPATYTKPWTVSVPMRRDGAPDRIVEYGCHEGNRGLRNILSGARVREEEERTKGQSLSRVAKPEQKK